MTAVSTRPLLECAAFLNESQRIALITFSSSMHNSLAPRIGAVLALDDSTVAVAARAPAVVWGLVLKLSSPSIATTQLVSASFGQLQSITILDAVTDPTNAAPTVATGRHVAQMFAALQQPMRLRDVDLLLGPDLTDADAAALLPAIRATIEQLVIGYSGVGITDTGIAHLRGARRLRVFALNNSVGVSDEGVGYALGDSPRLNEINLVFCGQITGAIFGMLHDDCYHTLRSIDVQYAASLSSSALAESVAPFTGLRSINVWTTNAPMLRSFISSLEASAATLTTFQCSLQGDVEIEALAATLRQLTSLYITTATSDCNIAPLQELRLLESLALSSLGGRGVPDVASLASLEHLTSLTVLWLGGHGDMRAQLRSVAKLRSLQTLHFTINVGSAVAELSVLPLLTQLIGGELDPTDKDVLAGLCSIVTLETLVLKHCSVDSLSALVAALPRLREVRAGTTTYRAPRGDDDLWVTCVVGKR